MAPSSLVVVSSGRRGRKRKPVTHYTDDNPSTFTTKNKRGSSSTAGIEQQDDDDDEDDCKASTNNNTTNNSTRNTNNKRRRSQSNSNNSNSTTTTSLLDETDNKGLIHHIHHHVRTESIFAHENYESSSVSSSSRIKGNGVVFGKGLGVLPRLAKPEWIMIETSPLLLSNHYMMIPPPPRITCMATTTTSTSSSSSTNLSHYLVMGTAVGSILIYTLTPIIRHVATITSTSAHKRHQQQQQSNLTQEDTTTTNNNNSGRSRRKVNNNNNNNNNTIKKKLLSESNAIQCIDFVNNTIVIASNMELECFHVMTQSLLWQFPLPTTTTTTVTTTTVTNVTIHPTRCNKVLVSVIVTDNDDDDAQQQQQQQQTLSPLWLIQKCDMDDDDTQPNVRYLLQQQQQQHGEESSSSSSINNSIIRCAALWEDNDNDDHEDDDDCILLVATHANEQRQTLLRLNVKDDTILNSVDIPIKGRNNNHLVESLSLSSVSSSSSSNNGYYIIVASTRGVRVYERLTFGLVHVYGDGITLHGHSLVFQQALLLLNKKKNNNVGMTTMMMIGVPHSQREPREFQETLQLWCQEKEHAPPTTMTLPGPPKCQGFSKVSWWCRNNNNDTIVACTRAGDVWQLTPTKTSDWPGVMYPPGYQIINNNLEYLEDEDEIDILVEQDQEEDYYYYDHDENDQVVVVEEEEVLKKAMLESLLANEASEQIFDVVTVDQNDESIIIPCHPDPRLKELLQLEQQHHSDPSSTDRADKEAAATATTPLSFVHQVLESIPTRRYGKQAYERMKDRSSIPTVQILGISSTISSLASKPLARSKRSRGSSVEAMMKASIDPELRNLMLHKEKQWSSGVGSTLRDVDKHSVPIIPRQPQTSNNDDNAKEESNETKDEVSSSNEQWEQQSVSSVVNNDIGVRNEVTSMEREKENDAGAKEAKARETTQAEEELGDCKPDSTATASSESNDNNATDGAGISSIYSDRKMDDAATVALEGMLALQRSFSEDALSPKKSVPVFVSDSQEPPTITATAVFVSTHAREVASPKTDSSTLATEGTQRGSQNEQCESFRVATEAASSEVGMESTVVADRTVGTTVLPDNMRSVGAHGGTDGLEASVDMEKVDAPINLPAQSDRSTNIDTTRKPDSVVMGAEVPVISPSEDCSSFSSIGAQKLSSSQDTPTADDTHQAAPQSNLNNVTPVRFCAACRGRMVIHACGKKEIPVDLESIARAQEANLEKEEEERKLLRTQKRREADARRREARKKKKEEEERQRVEEARGRLEAEAREKARLQAQEEQSQEDNYETDKMRAQMWQRLIASNGDRREEASQVQQGYLDRQDDATASHGAFSAPSAGDGAQFYGHLTQEAMHQYSAPTAGNGSQLYGHRQPFMHQQSVYHMPQQPYYPEACQQHSISSNQQAVTAAVAQPVYPGEYDRADPSYPQHPCDGVQQSDTSAHPQCASPVQTGSAQTTQHSVSHERNGSSLQEHASVVSPLMHQPTAQQYQYPAGYQQLSLSSGQGDHYVEAIASTLNPEADTRRLYAAQSTQYAPPGESGDSTGSQRIPCTSLPTEKTTPTPRQPDPGTYEQKSLPSSLEHVASNASSMNGESEAQQPRDHSTPQDTTQHRNTPPPADDRLECPLPSSIETCTSDQLGTAETLASLASICVQAKPLEPTSQQTCDNATGAVSANQNACAVSVEAPRYDGDSPFSATEVGYSLEGQGIIRPQVPNGLADGSLDVTTPTEVKQFGHGVSEPIDTSALRQDVAPPVVKEVGNGQPLESVNGDALKVSTSDDIATS